MAEFLFLTKEEVSIEERIFRRPKLSKNFTFFAILFILVIITPVILNKFYNYELEPVAPNSKATAKLFVVTPSEPLVTIAQNLKKENLIKNAFAFRLLVAQMGISKNVQAGDFRLSAAMSAREIARELTHGAIDIWITLPEGMRIEEQAARIEEKLKFGSNNLYRFDKNEYIKIAHEGYMFPDTYLIPKDATAQQVADRLRETFDQKVDKAILESAQKLNLTAEDVITLASLLEKEAKTDEEKPLIAGILLNRLNLGIALQVDATVSYAKGYNSAQNTWWGQVTTDDYKSVKSKYNTYLYPGLPQGPIASPGLSSIRAAANPKETDYLYYLHESNGNIHYARTIEEHNRNIKEFL